MKELEEKFEKHIMNMLLQYQMRIWLFLKKPAYIY
jgi:hypothetical protein